MSSGAVLMIASLFLTFGPDFPDTVGHVGDALVHALVPALLHHLLGWELEAEQILDRGDGGHHPKRIKNRLPPWVKNDALRLRVLEFSAESCLHLCEGEGPLYSWCQGSRYSRHRCRPPRPAPDSSFTKHIGSLSENQALV